MMTRRERLIAITAGAVIGLLALDQIVVTPLMNRADEAEARVEAATDELASAGQLFQNRLRARRNWKKDSGDSIHHDAQTAEGQLVNLIPVWARSAGLTLNSIRPERSESEQGFGKITVRAAGTGDLESVGRFLYEVQQAAIPVRVADVGITSRRDGTDDLSIQLGLSTIYLLPEETDTAYAEAR